MSENQFNANATKTQPLTLGGTGVKADSSGRQRKTVRFELNLIDGEQQFIHDILKFWKGQRKMATNVRKAILLFYDLAQGKTDKLQEYFPHIVKALTGQAVQDHADAIVERVGERLDQQADALKDQMAVMAQQAIADGYGEVRLPPPPVEAQITVSKAKKMSADEIGANFIKSAGNLGFFD